MENSKTHPYLWNNKIYKHTTQKWKRINKNRKQRCALVQKKKKEQNEKRMKSHIFTVTHTDSRNSTIWNKEVFLFFFCFLFLLLLKKEELHMINAKKNLTFFFCCCWICMLWLRTWHLFPSFYYYYVHITKLWNVYTSTWRPLLQEAYNRHTKKK